jgi:hypothetical protein
VDVIARQRSDRRAAHQYPNVGLHQLRGSRIVDCSPDDQARHQQVDANGGGPEQHREEDDLQIRRHDGQSGRCNAGQFPAAVRTVAQAHPSVAPHAPRHHWGQREPTLQRHPRQHPQHDAVFG